MGNDVAGPTAHSRTGPGAGSDQKDVGHSGLVARLTRQRSKLVALRQLQGSGERITRSAVGVVTGEILG